LQLKKSTLAFITLVFAASQAVAEPMPVAARTELLTVLNTLETSGCQFNRNGKWYSGADAKKHLLRKLDYVESQYALKSAEQFVDLAASESSYSGIAYQVKCTGTSSSDSNTWMKRELYRGRLNK
jgi:hypothetical protein